jgi:pimeloyl-ACP methyl ester carboxylesterase
MTSVFDEDGDGLSPIGKGIAIGVGALAASAIASAYLATKAETDNPPVGKFVDVDGVKVHYLELGEGEPIVFFHGNGAMLQDFASSGLLDLAAKSHRVIAFDRPGFGYSDRPADRAWTPAAQAKLFHDVFAKLAIVKPVVVGHSWGTLVAMRLAVDYPQDVARLVLLSGYFYPSARADTLLSMPGAMPVLGNIIQHTIGPIIGRLAANSTIEKLFKPLLVSTEFTAAYSKEMALRPSQLKAVAEETAMMPAAIAEIGQDYKLLNIPISIFAGSLDDMIDTDTQ